jgi:hypothetical protein
MNKFLVLLMFLFILFSFALNIGGLMHLIPLYFTSPLLFISLFTFLIYINNRKTFKGF